MNNSTLRLLQLAQIRCTSYNYYQRFTAGANSFNFESDKPVGNPMVFQVGVEADQRIAIGFDSVSTKALGH